MLIRVKQAAIYIASFVFVLTLLLTAGTPVVFAQSQSANTPFNYQNVPANQDYDTFLRNIKETNRTGVPNIDSLYGAIVIDRVLNGTLYLLAGDTLSKDPNIRHQNAGLIGFAGSIMGGLYANPPASGIEYMADMATKARLISPTYAQTQSDIQGFNRLQPIRNLWQAMANLAYLMFVPIFIYVGLVIMLRQKMGQSVVAVQNALPKIAISLVLVFFSFAIVGLMIDLMNYFMLLTVNYFISQGFIKNDFIVGEESIINANLFSFVKDNFHIHSLAGAPADAIETLIKDIVGVPIIKNIIGDVFGKLAQLVFMIATLFVIFQTILTLIKAYISVVLMTILGPLLLAFNALPGQKTAGTWFRNILANLAVFPAVLLLLLFASIIGNVGSVVGDNKASLITKDGLSWIPPFIGPFAGSQTDTFTGILSFGAILLMPHMLKQVQEFFKAKSNLPGGLLTPVQNAAAPFMAGLSNTGKGIYQDTGLAEQQRDKATRRSTAEKEYRLPPKETTTSM